MPRFMNSDNRSSSWKTIRKLINDVHLWLGIASGLILFLVCLSGTIFTFSEEIQEMLSPEMYQVEAAPGTAMLSEEEILSRVQGYSEGGTVASIAIPADKTSPFRVVVKKEGDRRGTGYLVNPYTGDILGDGKGAGSDFFMFMFRLHRWLLLDVEVGRPIVGWATVIFVLIILSGLVIWFPVKVKSWKNGLKIKINARWKRLNHDLHNALGFYSSLLLLVMALTGLVWSFGWYKDSLSKLLGVEVFSRHEEEIFSGLPAKGAAPLLIHDFIEAANTVLPYEGDYRVVLPKEARATVSVYKNRVGFFAPAAADHIVLDQYTGEVLRKEIFAEKPFNEKIAASIKPLHMGYVYGTFSKIIYFIGCLIATSLPVTGTVIWINKLRKKSRKSRRAKRRVYKKSAEQVVA